MKVLVTGHRGYIGCVLVPILRRAGHDVVGLDSGLFVDGPLVDPPDEIPALNIDVRDVTADQLAGFEAVLHLAGISNDPIGDMNPECTYEINFQASVRLARLAKHAGVPRFLFASSCSLYGAAGDTDALLTEEAPFNPVTPYGESKVMVEWVVSKLADDRFSPTFLRCATAYGYSPQLRTDLVVNNLVGYAFTRGEVLLKSDGTSWRPLAHIEDISRAYLAILQAPRHAVHNEAFNVGRSDENYQIRQIAEAVREFDPGSIVRFGEHAAADRRSYRVDCSKLERRLPEYQPQWNVRKGIEQLYEAYRSCRLTEHDFLGPRYVRLRRIKQLQEAGSLNGSLKWTSNGNRLRGLL